MLFTENKSNSALDSTIDSIALKVASTGPPPSAFAENSLPSILMLIDAEGIFPDSDSALIAINL